MSANASTPEYHLIIVADAILQGGVLRGLTDAILEGGMVLTEEKYGVAAEAAAALAATGLVVVARQVAGDREYVLLRRSPVLFPTCVLVELDDERYDWVERLQNALGRAVHEPVRVCAISYKSCSGVLGLAACLRAEPGGRALRCFYLPAAHERFNPSTPRYADQLAADLAVNVLRDGVWGSYRHLPLAEIAPRQVCHKQ